MRSELDSLGIAGPLLILALALTTLLALLLAGHRVARRQAPSEAP